MSAFLANALNQLREFLAKLSSKDKIRLSVLALLIVIFSISLALVLGRVNYATLYSSLNNAENGAVIESLKEMGVTYKVQGGSILVPAEQVAELRMNLESAGIQGGDLPTGIMDRALSFGTTSEDRQAYSLLQKQSDLRKTIMRMGKIDNCYVLLTMPQDSLFAKSEARPASASVMLEIKDGDTLTSAEAYSIGSYVMGAVPGLLAENISIVDSNLNLYPVNKDGDNGGNGSNILDYQYELRERIKADLETQVTNFLQPVFGTGHVRVSVGVSLNFDKEIISSVEFAPPVEGEDSGLVVSMQELFESSRTAAVAEGIPGTDTNGLGDPEYPYQPLADDELYRKILREMNYELNETRTEVEKAQGSIRDLSIAIILDSNNIEEDYSASVRDLVAQAIGVNTRYISVARLPLQLEANQLDNTLKQQNELMRTMERRELIKLAIIAVSVLLLVFLVLYFISTILRAYAPQPVLAISGAGGGSVDYLATEEGVFIDESSTEEIPISSKPETVEQLENFIERDPQAVAQLLRNWLSDDYR